MEFNFYNSRTRGTNLVIVDLVIRGFSCSVVGLIRLFSPASVTVYNVGNEIVPQISDSQELYSRPVILSS